MTLTMYDSTDVANLPDGADAYAGYTSGKWPTWAALQKRFGHAGGPHLVSIAIDALDHALCLDVEPGDAIAPQAVAWVKTEHARNVARPIVYTSAGNMDALVSELKAAGIARAGVRLWSAHYGDGEHLCGPATCKLVALEVDGTQWRNDAPGAGGTKVDESVLLDSFFAAPVVPVKPVDGYVVAIGAAGGFAGRAVVSHDSGKTWG